MPMPSLRKKCLSCLSHGCPHSFGSFLFLSKIFIEGYRDDCEKKVDRSWSSDFHTLNLLQLIRSCKVRCCEETPNCRPLTKVLKIQAIQPQPQRMFLHRLHMGVSKNWGTPKSSMLIGFSIINHPFGVPLFLETPIWTSIVFVWVLLFLRCFFWSKHHKLFLQWHLAGHGKRLKRHANCWEETLGRARSIEEFCSEVGVYIRMSCMYIYIY